MTGGLAASPAVGASHPSYPLGHAKSCKAHYVKKTERHKVKGQEVRYVECVYVSPKAAAPSVTTATTIPQTTTTTLFPAQSETHTPTFSASATALTGETQAGGFSVSIILNTTGLLVPSCPAPNLGTITADYPVSGSSALVYPFACGGPSASYGAVVDADVPRGGTTVELSYSGASYVVLNDTITLRPVTISLYLP